MIISKFLYFSMFLTKHSLGSACFVPNLLWGIMLADADDLDSRVTVKH